MVINTAWIYLGSGLVIILIMQGIIGGYEDTVTHLLEHLWEDVMEWKVHVLIFGIILVIYGAMRGIIFR